MRTAVRAHEIASLLDDAPDGLRCLSLDCFDTLLWRNVHAPADIFAEFPIRGGAIDPRGIAERRARQARKQVDGFEEVSIEAIYDRLMPQATAEARMAAVALELTMEARHCYAFAPTVALIRTARARGLKVIIVSDTYLSSVQLRTLIADAAGQEVADMIDEIFASSEHGVSKGRGLFRPVLDALRLDPPTILHLGDNLHADTTAPRKLGIRAVHFEQFTSGTEQRLRLEAAAAAMIDPAMRLTRPILQPHRPGLSLRGTDDAASAIGHDVLGPIMHALALWVREEAAALAANSGRPVKILFLLRDGYLPQRAYEAAGMSGGAAIEVSRFTATAASFRDEGSIRAYLADEPTERVDVLGRQMLLKDAEIAQIGRSRAEFCKNVLASNWVHKICRRSGEFADRLVAHVRREGGVVSGDAVMLVDLGYNGTVQNMVEAALVERLEVQVAGRYLLLRERWPTGFDKVGLIDVRHYETRVLNALCRPIAVLEQLATAAQGSVVDYHPNGKAIRKAPGVKGAQSATRDAVQQACIAYVRDCDAGFHRAPASHDATALREMAASVLARLLFLPQAEEIALLERFDHDVNLGTQDLVKLIDNEAAEDGLRRRGLPYLSGIDRMYLPGEIAGHGLPLALSLFSVGRFGLDLRHGDFHVGAIDVPLLIAGATSQTALVTQAYPTHDGFYVLTAPAGTGGIAIGVQLGAIAECVQIEEVAFYPIDRFVDISARPAAVAAPIFDAMEQIAPGLHRCEERGLIF
ncbi:MAG TPA: hydrolase, partial [Sphingomonas sp.]|nr:hydrolase [Sphingomonas sp.]